MRGGYQIIDFKNVDLTSGTAATIEGTYEAAASPYGKAALISGLVLAGQAVPEFFAPLVNVSDVMTGTATLGEEVITIEIADGDGVTVTVASGE